MLPNGLEWLLEMCGFEWPTGDEDKMMECAATWRQFAIDVEALQVRGMTAAGNVLGENAGDSIDGFNKTWEKFAGGSGYFDDARQGAELIAVCMDAAAMLIIGLKIAVIAQLVILAVEIAAAQAAAPFTLGLSEIGAMGAAAATRMILRKLLKEIAQQILQAVLETAKEPFVSALEAMVSDVVAQTVEQNFGKQSGYDLGRTAKTGYEEGKDALKNSGSTFGESLRDGAGSRAGHGARGGLTGGGNDADASASGAGSDNSPSSPSSSGSPSSPGSPSNDNSPSSGPSSPSAPSSPSNSPSSPGSPSGEGPSPSNSPAPSGNESGRTAPDIGSQTPSSDSPSDPSSSPAGGRPDSSDPSSPSSPSSSGPAPSQGSDAPSPFDVGTQAYRDSISTPTGTDSPTPDTSTPDTSTPGSTTPDSSTPSASTPDAPSADPSTANSSPDTSTSPGTTGSNIEGGPTPVPDTSTPETSTPNTSTPDSARPEGSPENPPSPGPGNDPSAPGQGASIPEQSIPDQRGNEPTPEPAPTPAPAPAPAPAPDNSSPAPGAQQVDRDSVTTMPAAAESPTPGASSDGNSDDNQNQGTGRGAMPSGAMPGNAPTAHASPGQGHTPTPSSQTPNTPDNDDITLMGGAATATPPAPADTATPQQTAPPSTAPSATPAGAMPPPTAGSIPTQTPSTTDGPRTAPRSTTPGTTTPHTEQATTRPTTPRDTDRPRPTTPPREERPRTERPTRPTTQPRGEQPSNRRTDRPTDHRSPAEPAATPPNNQQPDHQQPADTDQTPGHTPDPTHAAHQPTADDSTSTPQHPTAPPSPPQADNLSDIRNDLNIPHEGLTTPEPVHQQDLENAHPRNPDGTPQVFADPRQGNWAALQNDGGPGVPGRSNNCADCTRSFLETWFGRPTVSAPRTLDRNPDGSLNRFSAERDSVENQERWAGAPSTYAGDDHPSPYARISHELTQAGHGSAAMIAVNWPGGGGHAFAAVNHNGQVLFVDPQTGVVSENPIHLGAKEVFYTPLDADRNPITPYFLAPPADNTTPSTDSTTNQPTSNAQSGTVPTADGPTPADDNDADTRDQDAQDRQDTQDRQDDTRQPESEHQDSPPPDSREPDPILPATETRPSGPPDGYDDPTDADNRAQQERFPRNEDGSFQHAPDPRDGTWLNDIRGQNSDESGRDVNCPDGALAFVDSYAGNPTVAARRSPNEDGTPADTPEPGGRDRIENTLGAQFSDFGDGRDAYDNLESTLLNEGHGAQAVIITQNDDGRAHAWNVVNHNGQIVYADQQTGQSSTTPLHNGNNGVFAIPLDASRRPIDPANPPTAQSQSQSQTAAAPHSPAGRTSRPTGPTDPQRSADATRAHRNQSLPSAETANQQHANLPPDGSQQQLRRERNVHRIALDPVHDQMRAWAAPHGDPPSSPLRELLQESLSRRQDHVEAARQVRDAKHAIDDAKSESAAAKRALKKAAPEDRAAAQQRLADAKNAVSEARRAHKEILRAHRDNVSMPYTNFTDSDLRRHLDPAWSNMNDGDRYAALATLGRMSHSFHANNAVDASPEPSRNNDPYADAPPKKNKQPDPAHDHHESIASSRREASARPKDDIPPDMRDLLDATERNSPDFSDKNYAVVEVVDEHGESHYIIDSSVPAASDAVRPRHSETHILESLRLRNNDRAAEGLPPYRVAGLYTEREPCGLRAGNSGHADCSDTIRNSTAMHGVPVHYSTTYRTDPQRQTLLDQRRAELRRTEGLSEAEAKKRTEGFKTPNRQLMDEEIQHHLDFVEDLVQTLSDQNHPHRTPPASPAGTDRRPPADPAGTSRRPAADPAGTPTDNLGDSGRTGEHTNTANPPADEPRASSPASDGQPKKSGLFKQALEHIFPSGRGEPTELTTEVDQPRFGNHQKLPDFQPDRYGTPLDRDDGTRMPLFDGPPSREQTQQGAIGDCGIIAVMGAVASRYPERIQDLIHETEDGNYEVRFHEAARNDHGHHAPTGRILTVRVTPELPVHSELPKHTPYANAHTVGVAWPAIMEKAIAGLDQFWSEEKRDHEAQFPRNKDFDGNLLSGYSRITQGSSSGERAELLTQLTGQTSENHEIPTQYDMHGRSPDKQLLTHLRELIESGRPIIIGTRSQGTEAESEMEKGLRSSHAYEIVSVDDRALIQLRDPHNDGDPQPLTVKEFKKYCTTRYTTLEDEK
ncbi:toxin glutamine deamidase domain-containing protein [Streptomyces sp. BH106]|uniref:toxin glutamine deamidase domain-containing protein n=1 Tax=Streptomyces sp. BH106 TaxID=3410409 RepID=UPI003CE8E9F4